MEKLKKIHFKLAALQTSQLIQRLQRYLDSLDIALFIHRNNFKYFPHFAQELHNHFTQTALLYCIVKRFPGLVDGQHVDQVALSQQLKEQYATINLKILKKNDSFFYFLCIYFTKLASNFLQDSFVDILVQGHLEAQLYISLVHVMIGLEVSPKSYEINHRKVISQPLTFRTKTYLASKPDSIQSAVYKPSNKKINLFPTPTKKLQTKFTIQRKATHLLRAETPTETQSFKSLLKQNLLVQVLPQIPPKKLKASEFDKIAQLNEASASVDSQPRQQLLRVESEIIKPKNNFLYSTQNSTSYEMLFKKNDQNICNMHKTVKISHRPQLVQTAGRKIKKYYENPVQAEEAENNEKVCDMQCSRKNWEQIVRNIKQNTIYTTKHNPKSLWVENKQNQCSLAVGPAQRPITLHRLQSSGNRCSEENADERASTNGFVSQPAHLKTEFYEYKEKTVENEVVGFERERSQRYRVQRKLFDSQCHHRKIQTDYSLFNANNILTSFVKFGPHK